MESLGSPASGVRGMSRPTGLQPGLLIFDSLVDLTSRIREQSVKEWKESALVHLGVGENVPGEV